MTLKPLFVFCWALIVRLPFLSDSLLLFFVSPSHSLPFQVFTFQVFELGSILRVTDAELGEMIDDWEWWCEVRRPVTKSRAIWDWGLLGIDRGWRWDWGCVGSYFEHRLSRWRQSQRHRLPLLATKIFCKWRQECVSLQDRGKHIRMTPLEDLGTKTLRDTWVGNRTLTGGCLVRLSGAH